MGKTVDEMEARRKELAAARQKRWREKNKEEAVRQQSKSYAKRFATVASADDLRAMIDLYNEALKDKDRKSSK